jgi:hypothetical protein
MFEEFTALNEVHNEIDAVTLLEHIVEANNERVVHLNQDKFLQLERLNAFVLNDYIFANDLHCE